MIKLNNPFSLFSASSKSKYLVTFVILTILVIPFSDLTKAFAQEGVLDTIDVGDIPVAVAYNPDNGNMYVANAGSDTVSVIDSSNDVVDTVTVGDFPVAVAYNPGNGNMYVANTFSGTVSVLGSIVPTADAGADQTVKSGDMVELDGSGSTDPRNKTLTYQWTQIQGPGVALSDPTAVNPTFIAPDVLLQRDLVFELVVTNEAGIQSEPDSVTISVVSNLEGIIGSGNNINIQVQENSGNIVSGQSGFGEGTYSDSPILQGQNTEQDSQVVS